MAARLLACRTVVGISASPPLLKSLYSGIIGISQPCASSLHVWAKVDTASGNNTRHTATRFGQTARESGGGGAPL